MGRLGLHVAPKGRIRATPEEYLRLKALVLARAGRRCEACRGTAGPFEYHHVIERSQGGPDLAWNLLQLCAGCHALVDAPFKRGRLVTELIRITTDLDWDAVFAMVDIPTFVMEARECGWQSSVLWWVPPDGVRISYQTGQDKWAVWKKTLIRVIRFDAPR